MLDGDFVSVRRQEYEGLLLFKRQVFTLIQGAKFPRSWIERDEEVMEFLIRAYRKRSVDEVLTECLKRFGWKRTPSQSALYRFYKRTRKAIRRSGKPGEQHD